MAKTRALIIVDVQPTFCEGGALAVEGGNATAERIADFVTENADDDECPCFGHVLPPNPVAPEDGPFSRYREF